MEMVRKAFFAGALAALATSALTTGAWAQNYPWCAQYGNGTGGARNCGFSTLAQCQEDVSGIGGFCEHNNTYQPAGGHGRHRVQ